MNPLAAGNLTLLDHVRTLNAAGIPTFPCGANKRPLTERGFHDATTDPAINNRWFSDPAAVNIGIPTGKASGWSILDTDRAGAPWRMDNALRLPNTRCHRTRSGGFHDIFVHREGVRSSAGAIAPGIDIRGSGGYFVWWPARGHEIYDNSPVAEMPDWLFDTILAAQAKSPAETGAVKSPADIAPPDAAAVLALLNATPNPLHAGRDVYLAVNMATQGAIRGGLALERITDEEADAIKDAAAAWSARWEGASVSDFENEREKWNDDWSQRDNDLSGWPRLVALAGELGADVSREMAAIAAAEFGASPLPEYEPEVVEALAAPAAAKKRRALWMAEAMKRPPPAWLVEGLLQEKTFAMLVGPFNNAKSFAAILLGLHIANGKALCGRSTKKGVCVFILGEGMQDFPDRLEAARNHYDLAPASPILIFEEPTMFLERGDVDLLIGDIREECKALDLPVAMVVIDTVARATPGVDENAAGPMGVFVANCDRVKTALGCAVLAVHHTGKDATKGSRGSTALPAAADTIITATRDMTKSHDVLTLSITKQKSAAQGPDTLLDLVVMPAREGRTSLVPVLRTEPLVADHGAQGKVRLGGKVRSQYECLVEVISENGEGKTTRDEWFAQCVRRGLYDDKEDQRRKNEDLFRTRINNLRSAGWVQVDNDAVTMLRGPDGNQFAPVSQGD